MGGAGGVRCIAHSARALAAAAPKAVPRRAPKGAYRVPHPPRLPHCPQRLLVDRTRLTLTLTLTLTLALTLTRSDFFPIALGFLRNMPLVGTLLNLPIIRSVRARPLTRPLTRPAHAPRSRSPLTRPPPTRRATDGRLTGRACVAGHGPIRPKGEAACLSTGAARTFTFNIELQTGATCLPSPVL